MRIEPAHVEQLRRAQSGAWHLISADVGGVAADLRRIDRGLKVRFAENGRPPFWAVYHESEDGRSTYLVTTAQAYQNKSGTWEGLDHRIVRHIESIDPQHGYDFAGELGKSMERATAAKEDAKREKFGEIAEQAAHAVRTDLGDKSRASFKKK